MNEGLCWNFVDLDGFLLVFLIQILESGSRYTGDHNLLLQVISTGTVHVYDYSICNVHFFASHSHIISACYNFILLISFICLFYLFCYYFFLLV